MALRAFYLTLGMIAATTLWGVSVYSSDVMAGNVPADGYGISASTL